MKRVLRWLLLLLMVVILFVAAMAMMLYLPPVQRTVKELALRELSRYSSCSVKVEDFSLRFPLRLVMSGVTIDSLLSFDRLSTRIPLSPLFDGRIEVSSLVVEGITVNSDILFSGVDVGATLHRVCIDDLVYAWSADTMSLADVVLSGGVVSIARHDAHMSLESDTVSSHFPFPLHVKNMKLSDVDFSFSTPTMSLMAGAGNLSVCDTYIDTSLTVSLQSLLLSDGYTRYCPIPTMSQATDVWDFSDVALRLDSICYSSTTMSAVLSSCSFVESSGVRLREGKFSLYCHDGMLQLPYFSFRTDDSVAEGDLSLFIHNQQKQALMANLSATIGPSDMTALLQSKSSMQLQLADQYPSVPLDMVVAVGGTLDTLVISRCFVSLPSVFDLQLGGTARSLSDSRRRDAVIDFRLRTGNLDILKPLFDASLQYQLLMPDSVVCSGRMFYAPDSVDVQLALVMPQGRCDAVVAYRAITQCYDLHVKFHSVRVNRLWSSTPLGEVSMEASLSGCGFDPLDLHSVLYAQLHVDSLHYDTLVIKNVTMQATLEQSCLHTSVACADSMMHFRLAATARYVDEFLRLRLYANVEELNLAAFGVADANLHPAFQCNLMFDSDFCNTYALRGRFYGISLTASHDTVLPHDLSFRLGLMRDSLSLNVSSSDLRLALHSRTVGFPWQWVQPDSLASTELSHLLPGLQAELIVGDDNPVSRYLSLIGVEYRDIRATVSEERAQLVARATAGGFSFRGFFADSISLTAQYNAGVLNARLDTLSFMWSTPTMQLRSSVKASLAWDGGHLPQSLSGTLILSDVSYALPAYSLQLYTADSLILPFVHGEVRLHAVELYAGRSRKPLVLDGRVGLLGDDRSLHLTLSTDGTDLLQSHRTAGALLYGSAPVKGNVALDGPVGALSLTGTLSLLAGTSIHYIYKDVLITSGNRIDDVVTFVDFGREEDSFASNRYAAFGFSMNLAVDIASTAQLEVLLGGGAMNTGMLQGGGSFNLQYLPASGLRLSGRYVVESGKLNLNVPLLHVHQMAVRPGSTVVWSGDVANPMLGLVLEDRMRASVTLDGAPQSMLFLAGISLSGTVDKLGLLFTLDAPENASMQNSLATLSVDERSKLAVALLTTGLYLGEGGTGNLMNTALMGFVQSQLDDISRDAFRTVDVSVGVDPLLDGVSGVSTRTDYSFSVSKRFWNDRIRLVVGGSVTTSNDRIESDAIIDNISVEWRISPNGTQYLRFFYDKNYESILEGEIRETGVGYVYRKKF